MMTRSYKYVFKVNREKIKSYPVVIGPIFKIFKKVMDFELDFDRKNTDNWWKLRKDGVPGKGMRKYEVGK